MSKVTDVEEEEVFLSKSRGGGEGKIQYPDFCFSLLINLFSWIFFCISSLLYHQSFPFIFLDYCVHSTANISDTF